MLPFARTSAALLVAAALGCVLGPAACSNQGEGERCSAQNGNDDCQDGIACVTAASLGKLENYDRCCPPDPLQVTTSACTPTRTLPIGDSGSPQDTSVGDTSMQDTSPQDTSPSPDTSVPDSSKPADASTEGG